MDELLLRYRDHLAVEKRASPHTVRAYLADLSQLCAFAEARLPPAARPGHSRRP